jgi:RNA polymerase sigma factor (sigma-70 family)
MDRTGIDHESATVLVMRARAGDPVVWNGIVHEYTALIRAVCRRHQLTSSDSEDVAGKVWLKLVEQLATIRVPAALPGWLATTTARTCVELIRQNTKYVPNHATDAADTESEAVDAALLADERRTVLHDALACLSHRDQRLIAMLFGSQPRSYTDIAADLDIPIGAIGPTRQRCLSKLRRHPQLAALTTTTTD